ncbi:MAG: Ppx/GppA phosphatase family protein [Actinomycetota bacterium]|nr:Ppx/GppA phosphatase family protein [Actinomycetota bacterium]
MSAHDAPGPRAPDATGTGPLAAVDCGTNSTRLLVVDDAGRQLVRLMRITRLGEGVDASGVLDPAAIARTVVVLEEYRKVLEDHGVRAVRVAATSAVRDASNGRELLDAATRAIGAPAELLSGEEEGRLAFAGATSDLSCDECKEEVCVVVDIGGGSTELIAGACSSTEPPTSGVGAPGVVSLGIGCVRLTERFFHHDPPLADEQAACARFVDGEIDRATRVLPALVPALAGDPCAGDQHPERPGRTLIGLAGTVSTLSMLDQGLADYDWGRVHHSRLEIDAVERWCEVLAAEPAQARARRPGMAAGREDVIVAGAFVLRGVMRRLGYSSCLVSETDILDGLAASLRLGASSAG